MKILSFLLISSLLLSPLSAMNLSEKLYVQIQKKDPVYALTQTEKTNPQESEKYFELKLENEKLKMKITKLEEDVKKMQKKQKSLETSLILISTVLLLNAILSLTTVMVK